MRFFVTGATGFIGTHLCHRLVAEGHTVVALVRNRTKARGLPSTGIDVLEGDLSILKDRSFVIPPCDLVVHLAGVVAAPTLTAYREINFVAVRDLVECIARQSWKPRRLLFASSLAAGGPSEPNVPKRESDPPTPVDAYGQAKLDAEVYLRSAPFPTTSFRPALVFGPGDEATITLFRMAKRGFGFGVAGKNAQLSYVYVSDLIDALMKLADDPTLDHRTYYVSYPQPTDNRTLWEVLGRALGKRVFVLRVPQAVLYAAMLAMTGLSKVLRFQNQLDRKQYDQITATGFACTSDALQRDFEWRPHFDLEASIAASVEGFRLAGSL
ncbi:MAG: NAD-dependent epimerase/dehydratase family protein [Polyangiaceae bacterium]